jgi:hypothetical protein
MKGLSKNPKIDIPSDLQDEVGSHRPLAVFTRDRIRIAILRGNKDDPRRRIFVEFDEGSEAWQLKLCVHEVHFHKVLEVVGLAMHYLATNK